MKDLESIAVKAVQPIARSEPHKAFLVLHNRCNGVARKPVLYLVMSEIIAFGLPVAKDKQQRSQKKCENVFY